MVDPQGLRKIVRRTRSPLPVVESRANFGRHVNQFIPYKSSGLLKLASTLFVLCSLGSAFLPVLEEEGRAEGNQRA
jgi:hypothetical protein